MSTIINTGYIFSANFPLLCPPYPSFVTVGSRRIYSVLVGVFER